MIAEVKAKNAAEKAAMKKIASVSGLVVPIPAVLVGVFVTQVIIFQNSKSSEI